MACAIHLGKSIYIAPSGTWRSDILSRDRFRESGRPKIGEVKQIQKVTNFPHRKCPKFWKMANFVSINGNFSWFCGAKGAANFFWKFLKEMSLLQIFFENLEKSLYAHLQIIDFPRRFPLPPSFSESSLNVCVFPYNWHIWKNDQ